MAQLKACLRAVALVYRGRRGDSSESTWAMTCDDATTPIPSRVNGGSVMAWNDDELDRLVQRVAEVYGEGTLADAYVRAMNAAPAATIGSLDRIQDVIVNRALPNRTRVVAGAAWRAALKVELRRLVTPH
jgi:hypothetical protein